MKQCLKNGIAVQGYDAVEFFQGNAIKGSEDIVVEFNDANYLFTSEENKQKFQLNPEAFCPQYGGFCSMAMTKGQELRPNPKCFSVEKGKLYFYTRIFFGLLDAKKQWVKDREEKRLMANEAWKKLNS